MCIKAVDLGGKSNEIWEEEEESVSFPGQKLGGGYRSLYTFSLDRINIKRCHLFSEFYVQNRIQPQLRHTGHAFAQSHMPSS